MGFKLHRFIGETNGSPRAAHRKFPFVKHWMFVKHSIAYHNSPLMHAIIFFTTIHCFTSFDSTTINCLYNHALFLRISFVFTNILCFYNYPLPWQPSFVFTTILCIYNHHLFLRIFFVSTNILCIYNPPLFLQLSLVFTTMLLSDFRYFLYNKHSLG